MKLQSTVTEVTRNGVVAENAFTIKATGKAFRILSDGLYSNKIRAIIRELSCNAYDSHVAAGIASTPIRVHLPTSLEPWFSVQDFGIGMSHEDVMTLYTSYFESTKTQSNEFIGALGLGSKSPFSYTDSFTVTSVYDGVRRIYTAFISEEGFPNIALMTEDKVSTPNGIIVMVPVKNDTDASRFRSEAVHAYRFFTVPPEVNMDLRYPALGRVIYEGPNFSITQANYDKEAFAVQGMVGYPIGSLLDNISPEDKGRYSYLFTIGTLIMKFQIGDLDVAASREAIGYDKKTVANIIACLEDIHQVVKAYIEAKISSAPDLFRAQAAALFEAANFGAGGKEFLRGFQYKGQSLATTTAFTFPFSFELVPDGSLIEFSTGIVPRRKKKPVPMKIEGAEIRNFHLPYNSNIKIIWDNIGDRKTRSKINYYHENVPHGSCVLTFSTSKNYMLSCLDAVGLSHSIVKLASDLPTRIRDRASSSSSRVMKEAYVYDPQSITSTVKRSTGYDSKDGGYYVPMYHDEPEYGTHTMTYIFKMAAGLGYQFDKPVVGFRRGYIKRLGSNWKPFKEEALKLLADKFLTSTHHHELYKIHDQVVEEPALFEGIAAMYHATSNSAIKENELLTQVVAIATEHRDFKKEIDLLIEGLDATRYTYGIQDLNAWYTEKFSKPSIIQQVHERFPLLKFFNDSSNVWYENRPAVEQYIAALSQVTK